jgi:hypothetical protein
MSAWFTLAASMVVGILIGFASGYRTGQGQVPDVTAGDPSSPSAPTSGASTAQPFSESTVDGPLRLEEERIVPAPEDAGSAPTAPDRRGSGPTDPALDRRGTPAAAPVAVGQVPPETGRSAGGPARPTDASGPGSLQVLSRPAGAQVILDGKAVGTTPLTLPDVPAGPHAIRLELPGFNRWATTIDVQAGQPARVAASLEQ